MREISELNRKFGAAGRIAFRLSVHGLPEMVLVNAHGSCEISLCGGQVVDYRPMGHAPVLFTSRMSAREPGKPIRGGIPLCWPWFGAAPAEALPRHGFARLQSWQVLATSYDGTTSEVTLGIEDTSGTLALWPHRFTLTQKITLSDNLTIAVTTCNRGDDSFDISQSIHPYFKVRDIRRVALRGLDRLEYTDLLRCERHTQSGDLTLDAESCFVYDAPDLACAIHDEGLQRDTLLSYRGMDALAVWNPWERARQLQDFADDEYSGMITVAPATTAEHPVTLAPGATATAAAAIQVVLA